MKGARGKQLMSQYISFEKMEKQDFKTSACFSPTNSNCFSMLSQSMSIDVEE